MKTEDEASVSGSINEYAQVLLSIIVNSCEAALERKIAHPSLFITITRENDRSLVYLRDNCGGITEDVMPKIFEPYFTTRDPDKVAGIGLYASRTIIEQNMGGSLTVRNADGGAEFRIEV